MKVNILAVDDNIDLLKIINKGLSIRQPDWNVITTNQPEEVFTILKSGSFDLMLLDIMMPKINGLELSKKIKQNYNLPILFLTAKTDIDTRYEASKTGDDFVEKPFDIKKLEKKILSYVKK